MKNNFTKTNLFSCPIYKIRIDPNSYDKEKILNDIKYNKSLKNTRNNTHICDIHHSYNDFDNEDFRIINYEKLEVVYSEMFNNFFSKELHTANDFRFEFSIVNYTAMTEGQWFPVHNHIDTDDNFASIHYLNFKKGHNLTCFGNPATFAPFIKKIQPEMNDILDNSVPENSYIWSHFEVSVKEDDMIIFPAVLNHEIGVQGPTKEPRITIASNVKIRKEK